MRGVFGVPAIYLASALPNLLATFFLPGQAMRERVSEADAHSVMAILMSCRGADSNEGPGSSPRISNSNWSTCPGHSPRRMSCSFASRPAASAAATCMATMAARAEGFLPSSWAMRPRALLRRWATLLTNFRAGDRVTFDSTVYCGKCFFCLRGQINLCDNREVIGVSTPAFRRMGAFAEFVTVPARIAYALPDNMSFTHAALIEAVSVAVHAVSLTPDCAGRYGGCGGRGDDRAAHVAGGAVGRRGAGVCGRSGRCAARDGAQPGSNRDIQLAQRRCGCANSGADRGARRTMLRWSAWV